jgi:hypothetical protein
VFPPENGFVVVTRLTEEGGSAVNATNEALSAAAAPIVIVINSPATYSALSNVNVGSVADCVEPTVTVEVVVIVPAVNVTTDVPAATPVTSNAAAAPTFDVEIGVLIVATVVVAEAAVIATLGTTVPLASLATTEIPAALAPIG